jgi:hypothetical protein
MITQQARPPVRMLIAGVGYQHLRDMSLGPVVIAQLQQEPWPPGVDLADLSYGPIAVMHSLDDLPAYDHIIFVAGVSRARQPGRVDCYQWQHVLPDREEIQARVQDVYSPDRGGHRSRAGASVARHSPARRYHCRAYLWTLPAAAYAYGISRHGDGAGNLQEDC